MDEFEKLYERFMEENELLRQRVVSEGDGADVDEREIARRAIMMIKKANRHLTLCALIEDGNTERPDGDIYEEALQVSRTFRTIKKMIRDVEDDELREKMLERMKP